MNILVMPDQQKLTSAVFELKMQPRSFTERWIVRMDTEIVMSNSMLSAQITIDEKFLNNLEMILINVFQDLKQEHTYYQKKKCMHGDR